jgi:hypothetical protein
MRQSGLAFGFVSPQEIANLRTQSACPVVLDVDIEFRQPHSVNGSERAALHDAEPALASPLFQSQPIRADQNVANP